MVYTEDLGQEVVGKFVGVKSLQEVQAPRTQSVGVAVTTAEVKLARDDIDCSNQTVRREVRIGGFDDAGELVLGDAFASLPGNSATSGSRPSLPSDPCVAESQATASVR